MTDTKTECYLSFLRYCLSDTAVWPEEAQPIDWHDLLQFARRQAIEGVFWQGIQRIGERHPNKPSDDDVMEWMACVTRIRRRSEEMFDTVAFVSETFRQQGFRNCILKGQGNALLYPDPYLRRCGDIDVWVDATARQAVAYARQFHPAARPCYHHVDFRDVRHVPVEIHYRPSFMNNLVANAHLQRYFRQQAPLQFIHQAEMPDGRGTLAVPTPSFNRIFQMSHISNHFFHEGIGLRQLVDYYYLLRRGVSSEERTDATRLLRRCGMYRFATAVMYVMQEMLGLEKEYLLTPPSKRLGCKLQEEILQAGNFGHHDRRRGSGPARNALQANMQRLWRDVRLLFYFPSETLWEPVFRMWHFFWRKTFRT